MQREFRGGGRLPLLGRKEIPLILPLTVPPRKKFRSDGRFSPRPKVNTMYTGTMIDNLIASVERAEEHAEVATVPEPQPVKVEVYATYTYEFTYNSEALVGVA